MRQKIESAILRSLENFEEDFERRKILSLHLSFLSFYLGTDFFYHYTEYFCEKVLCVYTEKSILNLVKSNQSRIVITFQI